VMDVASSGMDVSTATIVRPMNASDTPKPQAIDTEPTTRNRAPNIKTSMEDGTDVSVSSSPASPGCR
jgi:hypothetical protein